MVMVSSQQQARDESLSMEKVIGREETFEDVLMEVSEWICTALAIASVPQGVFPKQVQITKWHDPAGQKLASPRSNREITVLSTLFSRGVSSPSRFKPHKGMIQQIKALLSSKIVERRTFAHVGPCHEALSPSGFRSQRSMI